MPHTKSVLQFHYVGHTISAIPEPYIQCIQVAVFRLEFAMSWRDEYEVLRDPFRHTMKVAPALKDPPKLARRRTVSQT